MTRLTVCAIGLILVGVWIHGCRSSGETRALPQERPHAPEMIFGKPAEGWPPEPVGRTNVQAVPWTEIPDSLTDERANELRMVALKDSRVREALGARFAFLGADEEEAEKGQSPRGADQAVRLTFFSYANNATVSVRMISAAVERVESSKELQAPTGPDEIKLAIAVALTDATLADKAAGLVGRAILAHPRRGEPGYGDRVLYVAFYQAGDDQPRRVAVIDLTDQKVLLTR